MAVRKELLVADSEPDPPPPVHEPLLRFTKSFSFEEFVSEHLIPSEGDGSEALVRSSARLIGQSRDGGVLFAWDKKNNAGDVITSIGWYTQSSPAYRTLYQHECQVTMFSASVNHERTLLTFTIKDLVEDEVIYDSYITEIQPQGRVFTLNLRSPSYRLLQFIQPDSSAPKNRIGRTQQTSHLLVLIPGVIICVYHFKMQIIRLGAIMVSQPEQEVIQKDFSWYQWDPRNQWLYYARFESAQDRVQVSVLSGRNSLVLHCKNFSGSTHQHVFTISLPLPCSTQLYKRDTTYYGSPFAFNLPVREMNLQVLHRSDGLWCVCLQHYSGVTSKSDHDHPSSQDSTPEEGKIDYSVYIIHNGYVLYGQVPHNAPTTEGLCIHFMLLGCFVAAYIPGVMLHLLNVGPQVDPCHHLTFGPELATPLPLPLSSNKEEVSHLSLDSPPVLTSAISSSVSGEMFLECQSHIIYDCSINVYGFFSLFKRTNDPELMEDLLHLMVVGFRHHGMALSMIEHICQTPMRMADHRLFAEFIISSSFANVYIDCKKYFAKQLPLTTSPTYHGKVSKNQDGVKLALIKLTPLPNFIKQLLVQSDQKLVAATPEEQLNYNPPIDQPFENLCHNAVISQPSLSRVDIQSALTDFEDQSSGASLKPRSPVMIRSKQQRSGDRRSSPSTRFSTSTGNRSGLLGRLTTLTRRSNARTTAMRPAQDPHDMLTFLVCDEDQCDMLSEEAAIVREKMVHALAKDLPLRAKNIAYNTVATYYSELERHSCTLLLVIWQSLGFNADNHPMNTTLCRSPTVKEQILYELLEAYKLAHLEIGIPVPNGFNTFYASMAYLCLDKVLFLQYLRNDVFVPTKQFVMLLLNNCDEEDAQVVFQIFCNLDYQLAEYALHQWNDPTVKQMGAVKST